MISTRRQRPDPRPAAVLVLGLTLAGLTAASVGGQAAVAPAAAAGLGVESKVEPLDPRLFPVPDELAANVKFWTDVYTSHDNDTVLLHDELHLKVIYAVLDFADIEASDLSDANKRLRRRKAIQKAESRFRSALSHLAAGRKPASEDEILVERLFRGVPGGRSKYSAARHRLRTQTCLKNRFAEAIERSGFFMPEIERVFERRGLPVELTRLPFVESLFQWNAMSSARAAGIWQFVASTARYYLKMELEYDQRYDPLVASDAAARFLADNYKALGTWPLAITAYNHGRGGMQRAKRRLRTSDLGKIATKYRSRSFGFASRNFYAEFIAAATIYKNREIYFPETSPFPALHYEEFEPALYAPVRDLAATTGTGLEALRQLNLALSPEVWAGNLYLPQGYPLRVPAGKLADFQRAYDGLPDNRRSAHQVGHYYKVRRGDTLGRIAAKFGTSVSTIQRANRLSSPHRIGVGQRLLIPPRGGRRIAASPPPSASAPAPGSSPAPPAASPPTAAPEIHVVRRGESLSRIADRYSVTVAALKAANGLRGDRIYAGQKLRIAGGGKSGSSGSSRTHVVRSGETLFAIARRYRTTVGAIQRANRLRGSLIRPSQVLVIP